MDRKHALLIFFAFSYAWAWLVFVPLVIFRGPLQWTALASFGPTVAALVTHRITAGSYQAFRIYTSWLRTLGATAIGVVLVILAYVILPAVATADPRKLRWSILTSILVYNYSTLLGGPLGEEPGWRGYALPRLEALFEPVRASLLLAILWAGWHLPMFLYPGWTTSPLWIFVLIQIGLSIILSYGTNLSDFSIIAAIAMHAAFNTVPGFLNGLFSDTQPKTRVPFEFVLALCGLTTAAVLIFATRGRLAYRKDSL